MGLRNITAGELPFIPAEWRNELVRGEVRPLTPPGFRHGVIATRLTNLIGPFVHAHALGMYVGSQVGFWIERGPDTVRGPHGAFVAKARLGSIDLDAPYVDGPPELAFEIVTPNDKLEAVREKAQMWLDTGAAMAVVLHPERRTALIFTRSGAHAVPEDGVLEFGSVIPGLTIPLAKLFDLAL